MQRNSALFFALSVLRMFSSTKYTYWMNEGKLSIVMPLASCSPATCGLDSSQISVIAGALPWWESEWGKRLSFSKSFFFFKLTYPRVWLFCPYSRLRIYGYQAKQLWRGLLWNSLPFLDAKTEELPNLITSRVRSKQRFLTTIAMYTWFALKQAHTFSESQLSYFGRVEVSCAL